MDHPHQTDELALRLAAFVAQALDLEENPTALAVEIDPLKRDPNAGISTLELDSSVGPAAFLVYHYALDRPNDEGVLGRTLFEADLATLERAAELDTPGPRILAHAAAGGEAYILATTPATYRALTGQDAAAVPVATPTDLLPTADTDDARRTAAADLLRLLRDADARAARWLQAFQAAGRLAPAAEGIAFNEEETALALFLLDNRSIEHLLQVLNLVLDAARRQAATAREDRPEPQA